MAMNRESARIVQLVGDNLRAERARRGMTQEQLARLTGFNTTQIARMERGETDSGISKYVIVAWHLGVAPTELLRDLERAHL